MVTTLDTPAGHLTLQFLAWMGEAPRAYGEVMDAWRTSCPRLSIWEDALADGLVAVGQDSRVMDSPVMDSRVTGGCAMRERVVTLTDRGRALLQRQGA